MRYPRVISLNKMSACRRFSFNFKIHDILPFLLKRHIHKTAINEVRGELKFFGSATSPSRLREVEIEGEPFRVLVIAGHTKGDYAEKRRGPRKQKYVSAPRYKAMAVDQDWTNVWPTAETFKWSVVPLPVRMGRVKRSENDGIPPSKYANPELMKIPNFLHLTPDHIKKHCQALKPLCTDWPEGLETEEQIQSHFPMTVTTREYVRDAPTHRDERARGVTLQVRLSDLELDTHAKDKFLKLVKDRYDRNTDLLTLQSDRCPLRRQNVDYLQYLLSVAYYEAWKYEPWEADITVDDMLTYKWELNASRFNISKIVQHMVQIKKETKAPVPEYVASMKDPSEEEVLNLEPVKEYAEAVEKLHNDGECVESLDSYKARVQRMLLPSVPATGKTASVHT